MKRFKRKYSAARSAWSTERLKRSNVWSLLKFIFLIGGAAAFVLVMIFFGFPLIEDLIKGNDPMARYQPKVESTFDFQQKAITAQDSAPTELYLSEYKAKNQPYIEGNKIIFTTRVEKKNIYQLDGVVVYDTKTQQGTLLPGVEKKYDNLLSPVLTGKYAVWIDSMTAGGGRIVGYDLETNTQFVIKDYAYAMPHLSAANERVAFMQWAGDATQRLYIYDLNLRQSATVKLYDKTTGNSNVSLSATDMVWAEYSGKTAALKRIVFDGDKSKYENYDFKQPVYEPKTNGRDIVFATEKDIISGNLMLSIGGGEPVKIAENVLNYAIGSHFVAYTKDGKVGVIFTNSNQTQVLTSDIASNILSCANQNAITYYDVTDSEVSDEVVWYCYFNEE